MADEITDYQIVPQYDDAGDVRWGSFNPRNWEPRDNKQDKDSGLLEGNYGHVNVPGAVHPDTVKSTVSRVNRYHSAHVEDQIGRLDALGTLRYCLHPDGKWYMFLLPKYQDRFLQELIEAGRDGIIFSGTSPQTEKNNLRKWVSYIRQLGICISTCPVHPTERPQGDMHASRYTLHSDIRLVPPEGAEIGDLLTACRPIVKPFIVNRKAAMKLKFEKALQKIEATWERFSGKNKSAAGTDSEASTPLHGDQGGNGFMD